MPRYEALPVDNNFDLGDASDSDSDADNAPHRRPHPRNNGDARPSSPVHHPLLDTSSPTSSPSSSSRAGPSRAPQNAEVIFDAAPDGAEDEVDDSYMQPPPTPPGGFHYPPLPQSPPPPLPASSNVPSEWNSGSLPARYHPPPAPQPSMLRRALGAIIPTHYSPRSMRILHQGGGMRNDGVFTNMSAKPDGTNGMRRGLNDESDNPDWVPEIASNQAPPSYLTAQADSVPPYYEAALGQGGATFSGPISPNASLLIDNLPPGSLFSFLWNLLVSLSFQFVGFLLTYLLHTSHAAKQGSRAGLGITLIQYGFYLRQRAETLAQGTVDANGIWHFPGDDNSSIPDAVPSFATAAEADAYYKTHNDTLPSSPILPYPDQAMTPGGTPVFPHELSVANEWLSFFLMTIGWFVLLTSVLSYWRVKRWERNVRRQAAEREREEAAAVEAVEGGSAAPASTETPNAEPERRRMAVNLNALLERVSRVGRVARVPRMMQGWTRVPGGARNSRAAGAEEESHRLEAVD